MKWAVISTWKMSYDGCNKAAELLQKGCKAGDAIVEGVCLVEDDPRYCSVGYSGLPDKEGHITLDGSYMDGDTLDFVADYYTYKGVYEDTYMVGDRVTVSGDLKITKEKGDKECANMMYRFTDIYNQSYYTPVMP